MKIRERLLECKIKAGIKSDYKLAEVLGTSRQRISEVMNGKCKPDAYIAVKMADILKIHPLMLLAEFEAETAKDETRRNFWVNFAQRIKTGAVAMLVLISIAFWSPEPKAKGLLLDTHNVYYVKLKIMRFQWIFNRLRIQCLSPIKAEGHKEAAHVRRTSWLVFECVPV